MDAIVVAIDDINQTRPKIVKEQKQSIGLIHQKMQDRYKVVEKLPEKADSFDNVFKYADAYGKIRWAYYGGRFKEQSAEYQNRFSSAIGGILGIKSAALYGVSCNAAAYVSQDLPFAYDTNKRSNVFLTPKEESYAYLAEASIDYNSKYFEAKVGRYVADMPYANSDDIRMSQNSFEGAWGHIHYMHNLSSQVFYIKRWAGFGSQDDDNDLSQNEFKDLLPSSWGMAGVSLAYRYNEESEASLWVHIIDKMASILYAEINGVYDINEHIHLDYGLQYSFIKERDDSGVDGEVYGAMAMGHYDDFFVGVAANFALVDAGKEVTDGFGGGPYFTSLDEATIAYASSEFVGTGIDMYRFSLGYDKKSWYSSFEFAYGYIDCGIKSVMENDLIYTLDIDSKWNAQVVLANFKISDSSNKFDRAIARLEYNF